MQRYTNKAIVQYRKYLYAQAQGMDDSMKPRLMYKAAKFSPAPTLGLRNPMLNKLAFIEQVCIGL